MVTAILIPSNLTIPRVDDVGAKRQYAIRSRFMELSICKWIEQQRMSYHTGLHGRNWAVFLHISEEEFHLLRLKLNDPSQVKWVA